MIDNKTVLAIIPARGGSKGIPRKNIKLLAGKPLIAWTIEEGKRSKYVDRLVLTSEDAEIISVAKSYGCDVPFVRSANLSTDDTPGIDPVLNALKTLPEQYDYVVLLQPTSPLRTVEDIDGCIEKLISSRSVSCVSVVEAGRSPYWMYSIDSKEHLQPLFPGFIEKGRRQDLPAAYMLNGAIYIAETHWIEEKKIFVDENTVPYVMETINSFDIDTETDFRICDYFLSRRTSGHAPQSQLKQAL